MYQAENPEVSLPPEKTHLPVLHEWVSDLTPGHAAPPHDGCLSMVIVLVIVPVPQRPWQAPFCQCQAQLTGEHDLRLRPLRRLQHSTSFRFMTIRVTKANASNDSDFAILSACVISNKLTVV